MPAGLTTIYVPTGEMGRLAADYLIARIASSAEAAFFAGVLRQHMERRE